VVAAQVVIDDDIVKLVFGSFLPPQMLTSPWSRYTRGRWH
jgi:hypothetical protein